MNTPSCRSRMEHCLHPGSTLEASDLILREPTLHHKMQLLCGCGWGRGAFGWGGPQRQSSVHHTPQTMRPDCGLIQGLLLFFFDMLLFLPFIVLTAHVSPFPPKTFNILYLPDVLGCVCIFEKYIVLYMYLYVFLVLLFHVILQISNPLLLTATSLLHRMHLSRLRVLVMGT